MIGLKGKVFVVQIKGKDTVETAVDAIGRCHEIGACPFVHRVDGEPPINALVDLRKKIDKVETRECFLVFENGLVANLFTDFQAKWVIVI